MLRQRKGTSLDLPAQAASGDADYGAARGKGVGPQHPLKTAGFRVIHIQAFLVRAHP